jgi:hypothetical protein
MIKFNAALNNVKFSSYILTWWLTKLIYWLVPTTSWACKKESIILFNYGFLIVLKQFPETIIPYLTISIEGMLINDTFNMISVTSWRSTRRKPPTCRKWLTNLITWCSTENTSTWAGFEFIALEVIGIDWIVVIPTTVHSRPWQPSSKYVCLDTCYNF